MAATLIEMTSDIVAAYVGANKVATTDVPALIKAIYGSLATVDAPEVEAASSVGKPTPAQIRRSIKPDGLISFEDGKTYKTLKRHLTTYGLTIAEYKAKWGLPADYPTTSPEYSAQRSSMAKSLGLGRKGAVTETSPEAPAPKSTRKAKAEKS